MAWAFGRPAWLRAVGVGGEGRRRLWGVCDTPYWEARLKATLYVGGLETQINDDQLRTMFGQFGPVTATRLVIGDDGHCRGFAYVTFDDDLAAAKARVALDGVEIAGRTLRVALAT